MFKAVYTQQFEKDVARAIKRSKDMGKLKAIVALLLAGKSLPIKNRNHKLQGNYKGYWECHIEPDWLLIYAKNTIEIILVRTGTHSDLF